MNILENQQLAEPVDSIYIDLEAQILQNIARHLQGWEQPIDTDRWLMQKLAEIGKLNQENIRLIAKMSGLSQTAAERMLNEAAQDAMIGMIDRSAPSVNVSVQGQSKDFDYEKFGRATVDAMIAAGIGFKCDDREFARLIKDLIDYV